MIFALEDVDATTLLQSDKKLIEALEEYKLGRDKGEITEIDDLWK